MDRESLSREDIQAILEAREAKERDTRQKAAQEFLEFLDRPRGGMSRKFTFDMFGSSDEDDEPPAA